MITKRFGFTAAALLGLIFGASGVARGDLTITVMDPATNSMTFLGAPPAAPAPPRIESFSNADANFSFSVQTTDSQSPLSGFLSTTTIDTRNVSGTTATLLITVVDNMFSEPIGAGVLISSLGGSLLGTPGGSGIGDSVNFISELNPGGYTTSPGITGTGTASSAIINFSPIGGATTASATSSNPYTLTSQFLITLNPGDTATVTGTTTFVTVPEPTRLVGIFGIAGLMGLGLMFQRSRRVAA